MTDTTLGRKEKLHRRALWLERFTVAWNVAEAAVETWVCAYLSVALLAAVGLNAALGWWWADPIGALAMLPVIVWQGWETLEEAREGADDDD